MLDVEQLLGRSSFKKKSFGRSNVFGGLFAYEFMEIIKRTKQDYADSKMT